MKVETTTRNGPIAAGTMIAPVIVERIGRLDATAPPPL